jgi:alpha-1,6-mannosyltransferase
VLVHEVGFNAHPDIIGLALLAWALVLCRNFAAHRPYLWPVVAMGALLGLMVSARPFAGLLAALVLVALGKHSVRAALLAGVVTAAAALLLHLPFLSSPGAAGLTSLKTMADGRMFNALIAEVVFRNLPVSTGQALLAAGLLLSVSLTTWFWWRRSLDQPPATFLELLPGAAAMGFFLLWSPAINPWYALWILPFAVLHPRVWSWTALIVVSLSYASFRNVAPGSLEGYRLLPWVQPVEAVAVVVALAVDLVRLNRARRRGAGP